MRTSWLSAAGVLLSLCGCGLEPSSAESTVNERWRGGEMPTLVEHPYLLSPYYAVLDKVKEATPDATCVDAFAVPPIVDHAGGDSRFVVIQSQEQLEQELGLSGRVSTQTSGAFSGVGSLLQKYKSSRNSITLLFTSVRRYDISDQRTPTIPDSKLQILSRSEDEFVRACGTHYIKRITVGARLSVLIRYDFASAEDADAYSATFQGATATNPKPTTGEFAGQLRTLNGRSHGQTEVLAVADGATGGASVLALGGVTEQAITSILRMDGDVAESFNRDYQHDVTAAEPRAEGALGGMPGYYSRSGAPQRTVVPLALTASKYAELVADASLRAKLERVDAKMAQVEAFLSGNQSKITSMEQVYNNEIAPFLSSSPEDQLLFNIAPPGHAVLTRDAVKVIAERYAEKFRPVRLQTGVTPAGSLVSALQEDMNTCVERAFEGDYSRCQYSLEQPSHGQDDDLRNLRNAVDALGSWTAHDRVVPLRMVGEPKRFVVSCPTGSRFVTKAEAPAFSPWVNAHGELNKYIYYPGEIAIGGVAAWDAATGSTTTAVLPPYYICVPASGPFVYR